MENKHNRITKGRILVYRVFDIGEEVDLEKTEKILVESAASRSKFRLKKINQQAVIVSNDPLSISLGTFQLEKDKSLYIAEISAKIWDFGTLSLTFEFPIPAGISIDELKNYSGAIQECDELDSFARAKARELSMQIQTAMAKMNEWEVFEDYILYFVEKFEHDIEDASVLLNNEDVAGLILNEDQKLLSRQIKERIYESKLQYYKNDLAVIDWNSGFIVEPSGSMDIPDVIEFALNQLLEMRYYDDLLDKKLRELYSATELKDMSLFSTRYRDLALEAGQKYIEIAEIVESVENSLKVIGDLYHSVIFRMASKKFRFTDWQSSIDNKLENLADLSKLLLDNINHQKSLVLDITIIIIISLELIPLFEHIKKFFH